MPGLLRGVARTAVIAGTASAVNGRVQRRQAAKFADKDAAVAADRTQAYNEQMAAAAPAPAPVAREDRRRRQRRPGSSARTRMPRMWRPWPARPA